MFFVWGSGLYGRVDRVPGLFSVATKFITLYWIPVIPLQTWAVLEGSETAEGWRGVRIGLSLKSILVAWMRTTAVLSGIGSVIWLAFTFRSFRQLPLMDGPVGAGVLLAGSLFLYQVTRTMAVPSLTRATSVARKLGISPDVVAGILLGPEKACDEEEADDQAPAKVDEPAVIEV